MINSVPYCGDVMRGSGETINLTFTCFNLNIEVLFQLKETLSCDSTITACLMFLIVISLNTKHIAQIREASTVHTVVHFCHDFDIVKVWKD